MPCLCCVVCLCCTLSTTPTGLGWDYNSLDRIHPLQVLVLYSDAGTQLTDIAGILTPLVDNLLLPVARFLGFKSDYPGHKSKHVSSASSSSEQQQQQEELEDDVDDDEVVADSTDSSEASTHGHEEL